MTQRQRYYRTLLLLAAVGAAIILAALLSGGIQDAMTAAFAWVLGGTYGYQVGAYDDDGRPKR